MQSGWETSEAPQDKNYWGRSHFCCCFLHSQQCSVWFTDRTFCLFQVLHSPFDDIEPRETKKSKKEKDKDEAKQSQSKATKSVFIAAAGLRHDCLTYLIVHSECGCWLNWCFRAPCRNFSLLSFGEEAEEEEEMVNQVSQVLKHKTALCQTSDTDLWLYA